MRKARPKDQQKLFEEPRAVRAARLPPDVQDKLRQALVQWLRAVAKETHQEDRFEQDHR